MNISGNFTSEEVREEKVFYAKRGVMREKSAMPLNCGFEISSLTTF
jgi:hypothetical protein